VDLMIEIDSAPEDLTILTLKVSADPSISPLLRKSLADVIGKGRDRLAVDLSAVRFHDAATREVLAKALDDVTAGGGFLCLISPPSDSPALLEDLGSTFITFRTKAEAIEQLSPRKP
jgi:anti-anti-sigma regulatory factor